MKKVLKKTLEKSSGFWYHNNCCVPNQAWLIEISVEWAREWKGDHLGSGRQ
jgi:hypothetical protein